MSEPRVAGLFTGPEESGPIQQVDSVNAVAGFGIEGDRYFLMAQKADEVDPTEHITLFESEGIELTNAETDLDVQPIDMRRNVMTSGVALLDVIGKHLKIGDAIVEPLEDNPTCSHLEKLTGKALLKPMVRRGGVRGRIVSSGTIRVGDPIEVLEVEAQAEAG